MSAAFSMLLALATAALLGGCPAPNSGPEAPDDLAATPLSPNSVSLSWQDRSRDEIGFRVERKTGSSAIWTESATLAAGSTAYVDTGLSESTSYRYRVFAYNVAGESLPSNEAFVTTPAYPPAAPSGLIATAVSVSRIDLAWTDNSGNETGFKIERSPNGSSGWSQIALTPPNVTGYGDSGLSAGTSYWYRVCATNTGGDSAYSSAVSASTWQNVPYQADFALGSFIIPMDTTYQDEGMFKAYGLVNQLLENGIPVYWSIKTGKNSQEVDFVATAKDHVTSASVTAHGYRGGPFIVDSANAASAVTIIDSWQASYSKVTVHEATVEFSATVAKVLRTPPRIALFADGSQSLARTVLAAAGILDSAGEAWPDTSPDVLSAAEVAGATTTSHHDGALFDASGAPVYTDLISMHWGAADSEVIAEVRHFLTHPTHLFAQCQSGITFENGGLFLTTTGFETKAEPSGVTIQKPDSPFAQFDGTFGTVNGTPAAFCLPAGGSYLQSGVALITANGYAEGQWDVWISGFMDGTAQGAVSYLGGHAYGTTVPISTNPDSQGTRLLLNSIHASAPD